MDREERTRAVRAMVEELIAEDTGYFVVDVTVRPVNNVKVYLDADEGVVIERCVSYNRRLRARIEESGLFPEGDFSLEVSSPGIDEPLRMFRQYRKNIGRTVEVVLADGAVLRGILKEAKEEALTLVEEVGRNRKRETREHLVPMAEVRTTTVQVVF